VRPHDFATLAEAHRQELRVHCYRMLGSFDEAEDRANGRPAVAGWATLDGAEYHAFAVTVLRIVGDRVAEMTAFHEPHLFPAFGLPMSFRAGDRLPGHHD
jgi:hypothetical protein